MVHKTVHVSNSLHCCHILPAFYAEEQWFNSNMSNEMFLKFINNFTTYYGVAKAHCKER